MSKVVFADQIVYRTELERAKYAARNEDVVAALNDGARFSTILVGHEYGKSLDLTKTLVVLEGGQVWAYPVFAQASGLKYDEVPNDLWDFQPAFERFLKRTFGNQFAGAVAPYHHNLPTERRAAIAAGKMLAACKATYAESWGVAIRVDWSEQLTRTAIWRCGADHDDPDGLAKDYEDRLRNYPHQVTVVFGDDANRADEEIWASAQDRYAEWPTISKAIGLLDKMQEVYAQNPAK